MTDTNDALLEALLQTFATEADDHLQTLNQALLKMERAPEPAQCQELLQEAFRAAHSLKGAARAVSASEVEGLASALENVLQQARSDALTLTPAVCDVLYDTLDTTKR